MDDNNILDRQYRCKTIKRFDKNKKHFMDIVFEMESFTLDDLYKEYLEKYNDIVIDSEQSIEDLLNEMVRYDSLKYNLGKYITK
jgi:hypothetical protein